jgi:hypothetical protein
MADCSACPIIRHQRRTRRAIKEASRERGFSGAGFVRNGRAGRKRFVREREAQGERLSTRGSSAHA